MSHRRARSGAKNDLIHPGSLAFDIDGVFADTMGLFLQIAGDDYQLRGIGYEQINCYDLEKCLNLDRRTIDAIVTRIMDGDYPHKLQPFPHAATVLKRLGREHAPVRFVTARPYPGPIYQWIVSTLQVDARAVEIHTTGSFEGKVAILKQNRITHFVEDRLETCYVVQRAGITPIVYRQPWNRARHPFQEVGDWRELEALIAFNAPDDIT